MYQWNFGHCSVAPPYKSSKFKLGGKIKVVTYDSQQFNLNRGYQEWILTSTSVLRLEKLLDGTAVISLLSYELQRYLSQSFSTEEK